VPRPQINPADTHVSAGLVPERRKIGEPLHVATLMANAWTRVPQGRPPLDPLQLRLLPVAGLFMGLMWSRPGGLSLRTTWVTPATIWLGLAAVLLVGIPAVAAVGYGLAARQGLEVIVGLIGAALAGGAGTVALYGIRQRRLVR
jgi:hypothetical protein